MKFSIFVASFLFVLSASANESRRQGVIYGNIECNNPSGLGILPLQEKQDGVLTETTLRVNSKALCGAAVGQSSRLASISTDAYFAGKVYRFEVVLTDGYVTSVTQISPVDYSDFIKDVKQRKYEGLKNYDWFFQGPGSIGFNEKNIDQLIQKYTRQP